MKGGWRRVLRFLAVGGVNTGFGYACYAGFVLAVSDLALIILAAPDASLAQDGTSPQRTSDRRRTGSFGSWRKTGMGCVGAML